MVSNIRTLKNPDPSQNNWHLGLDFLFQAAVIVQSPISNFNFTQCSQDQC